MPKKYKQKSLLTKPVSGAPSNLSLSRSVASQDEAPKSVNDLIRESRRGKSNDRPQSVQTASSVPPQLRAMLDLPIPIAPIPRIGMRGPTRLRRIPGPPPPKSWLTDSIHAPSEVRNISWSRAHERTRVQKQASNLPHGAFPPSNSLQHMIMKSMATNWIWHAEYDHEYLAELPVGIKETLLSYIAVYSEGQGPNPLTLLFPVDLDEKERDEVRRLDLGNAIGGWSTIKKIERELEKVVPVSQPKEKILSPETLVPESWDEDVAQSSRIPSTLSGRESRFHNLKHLSLAVTPGTTGTQASWSGLLSLTAKLSTITSLSLAYWPQPTYTPNASTRLVKVKAGASGSVPTVTYGGTNFYSSFDNDWREAAGILRSLSRFLYCLKWLDLTGCGDWFSALTWTQQNEEESGFQIAGPDWNGSWRGVEQLILAVGWSPAPSSVNHPEGSSTGSRIDESGVADEHEVDRDHSSNASSEFPSLQPQPHNNREDNQHETWNVEDEREKYYHRLELKRHTEILDHAKEVASQLRQIRKESNGKWIDIDFGTKEVL